MAFTKSAFAGSRALFLLGSIIVQASEERTVDGAQVFAIPRFCNIPLSTDSKKVQGALT